MSPVPITVHEEQQKAGEEEEVAIHDPEGEARLQHRARLVHAAVKKAAIAVDAGEPEGDAEVGVEGEVGAVGVGNGAKFVHACDEGADKAEVDKGDEEGGFVARFAPHERCDCPYGREHGDDEEGEDVAWRELVCFVVFVDEIGLLGVSGPEEGEVDG